MKRLETILEQKEFDFSGIYNHLKTLQQVISENPQNASLCMPAFYHLYNDKIAHSSDLRPTLLETYSSIITNLSLPDIQQSFDKINSEGKDYLIIECTSKVLKSRPELSDFLYEQIKNKSQNITQNNRYSYLQALTSVIIASENNQALQILDESLSLSPDIKLELIKKLPSIYKEKPDISENIWKTITSLRPQSASELSVLYNNLSQICGSSPDKIPESMAIAKQYILSPQNDNTSLKNAYTFLGTLKTHNEYRQEIDDIIHQGLMHPNNSKESRRQAHRIIGNYEELCSTISIGQRMEKDDSNPIGWKNINKIPVDEPCVLFLGGDGTTSDKAANGYLKSVEKLLEKEQITENINLYSVVYDFGSWDDRDIVFNKNNARTKLMQDYKRQVRTRSPLNDDTVNPRYIKRIFDIAFLPRLADENGQRLSTEQATQNIRNLNIIAHCHGAYTFLKLEEMMTTKMKELGYKSDERQSIQKQLLCIAHAPYCPLGVSKSSLISFCSAKDYEVSHHNNFQQQIMALNQQKEMKLSYFPNQQGEVFICSGMGEGVEEHNFIGYELNQKGLSNEGKAILAFSGKAITNGLKKSINKELLTDTQTLICDEDDNYKRIFNATAENGKKIYKKILSQSILKHKIVKQQIDK